MPLRFTNPLQYHLALCVHSCCWLAMILVANGQFAVSAEPPAATPKARTTLTSNKDLEALLKPVRESHKVPGLVAGILENEELTHAAAVGVRKLGSPEAITVNDKLHLGSDTKAMTATLMAELVEEKLLSWDSTIGDVFSQAKASLHPDYLNVTLTQLLTHRAGLPTDGPWWNLGKGSLIKQRETLLVQVLGKPPVHPPGTKTHYSNVGYAIAGHMAEQVTKKSWEDLITARLFKPLKMSTAGFGIPGTKGKVNQPWGHHVVSGSVAPIQIDNDPALGPAGTVHCSLQDWSRFIAVHLQGAQGTNSLLKPETIEFLHTPPSGEEHARGWIVTDRQWGKGTVLTHSGSNTTWYATVWIAPALNTAFMAVTNQGGQAGQQACDAAIVKLIEFHEESAAPRTE